MATLPRVRVWSRAKTAVKIYVTDRTRRLTAITAFYSDQQIFKQLELVRPRRERRPSLHRQLYPRHVDAAVRRGRRVRAATINKGSLRHFTGKWLQMSTATISGRSGTLKERQRRPETENSIPTSKTEFCENHDFRLHGQHERPRKVHVATPMTFRPSSRPCAYLQRQNASGVGSRSTYTNAEAQFWFCAGAHR